MLEKPDLCGVERASMLIVFLFVLRGVLIWCSVSLEMVAAQATPSFGWLALLPLLLALSLLTFTSSAIPEPQHETLENGEISNYSKHNHVDAVADANGGDTHRHLRGNDATNRIVGGQFAQNERFPFIASLQVRISGLYVHTCGGSLIAPDIVVTAAHCVDIRAEDMDIFGNPLDMLVRIDPYRVRSLPDPQSEAFKVEAILLHPLFRTVRSLEYDYALLKLRDGPSTKPFITLNTNLNIPVDGDELIAAGWGREFTGGSSPNVLKFTSVYYINNDVCSVVDAKSPWDVDRTIANFSDVKLCTLSLRSNTCHGDSGGPIVLPGKSHEDDILVGMPSYGYFVGCTHTDFPKVAARISGGYDFIRDGVCRFSEYPPTSFNCTPSHTVNPQDAFPVTVRIYLDSFSEETGWQITTKSGQVVAEVIPTSYAYQPSEVVTQTVFLETNRPFVFSLFDTFGDGILGGSAFVFLGKFADFNNVLVFIDGNGFTFDATSTTFLASPNAITFSFEAPTATPTVSQAPSLSPTSSVGLVNVTVFIQFDLIPGDVGWSLAQNLPSGKKRTLCEVPEGTYSPVDGPSISKTVAAHVNEPYVFSITDAGGDGICCSERIGRGFAAVFFGDAPASGKTLVYENGAFGSSQSHQFVLSEDNTFPLPPLPTFAPTPSPAPTSPLVLVTLAIQFDAFPTEISVEVYSLRELQNSNRPSPLYAPSSRYFEVFQSDLLLETLLLESGEIYVLFVDDDVASNGLCCGYGEGYAAVYLGTEPSNDRLLLYLDGKFTDSTSGLFLVSEAGIVSPPSSFPPPVKQITSPLAAATVPLRPAYPSLAPVSSSLSTLSTSSGSMSAPSPSFLPTTTQAPTDEQILVLVLIHLDNFPTETTWSISRANNNNMDDDGSVVVVGGPYGFDMAEKIVEHTVSLDLNGRYVFSTVDAADDGICCTFGRGNATVYLGLVPSMNMILAFDNGQFGDARSHPFLASFNGFIDVTQAPTGAPSTMPPTILPTLEPSEAPSTSLSPSKVQVEILVEIQLDSYPWETSWNIRDASMDPNELPLVRVNPGTYNLSMVGALVSERYSLALDGVYVFEIGDTTDDGIFDGNATVYLGSLASTNMVLVHDDGNFANVRRHSFVASKAGLVTVSSAPTAPSWMPSQSPVAASMSPSSVPSVVPSSAPFLARSNTPSFSSPTLVPTPTPTSGSCVSSVSLGLVVCLCYGYAFL